MSVHSVTEKFSGRGGGDESQDSQKFTRSASRVFDVLVDNVGDTEQSVLASGLVPVVRSQHPSSIWLRANKVYAKKLSPFRYEVTADYEGELSFSNNNPNGPVLGPLDQPAKLEWDYIVTHEGVSRDVNGDTIATVCNERYDPPITAEVYTPVLKIERNVPDFSPPLAKMYTNKVNSKTFYGEPPGAVRSGALRGHNVNDETYSYWTISMEFMFRDAAPGSTILKAWYYRTRAEGYLVNFGAGLTFAEGVHIAHAKDDDGQPSPVPVTHAMTTGRKLDAESDDQFYEFEIYKSVDFNQLGIL